MELKNKTAIVCGCTQGIGYAIAKLFASNGCNLILFARNELKLKAIQEEWQSIYSIKIYYIVADFTNSDMVNNVIGRFYKENKIKVDILINNVGGTNPSYLYKSKAESIKKVFEKHLLSSHNITMATVENMKATNTFGKIINICANTSISPYAGLGLSAIRAAEIYWSKTLSMELAKFHIYVNNILPGPTNTEELKKIIKVLADNEGVDFETKNLQIINSLPLRRFAEPLEIAHVALFLASDKATYITGSNIKVDGGFNVTI